MRMRFIGQYTNGRDTITYLKCTFTGHEPREVPDEVVQMLAGNIEFETVAEPEEKKAPAPRRATKKKSA